MATWADLQDALHRAQERTGKDGPGGAEVAEAIALARELKAQAGRLALEAQQGAALGAVVGALGADSPFGLYARRRIIGGCDDAT